MVVPEGSGAGIDTPARTPREVLSPKLTTYDAEGPIYAPDCAVLSEVPDEQSKRVNFAASPVFITGRVCQGAMPIHSRKDRTVIAGGPGIVNFTIRVC